jgi:hypothetical protein
MGCRRKYMCGAGTLLRSSSRCGVGAQPCACLVLVQVAARGRRDVLVDEPGVGAVRASVGAMHGRSRWVLTSCWCRQ